MPWSSPGTCPEPEVAKGQGPQQIDVYSSSWELLSPKSQHWPGTPSCRWGLGDHRGGGGWGRKRRAGRQVGGGAYLLSGSGSKASPSPIHPQGHPRDQTSEAGRGLRGDHRDRAARAKAAVSQAGATVRMSHPPRSNLTLAWARKSRRPAATAGPRGDQ